MIIILFIAACFLAYSNGSNDNFKGVATLFGSGTANFKNSIRWATITTMLGSLAAIFLASSLVKNFSGKGLVPDLLIQSPEFAVSIALGASITVFLATRIGMPISTTHSLVGALFGTGIVAVGSSFNFEKLGGTFLIPLIISPMMAALLSLISYLIFRWGRKALGVSRDSCICVATPKKSTEMISEPSGLAFNSSQGIESNTSGHICVESYNGRILGISAQSFLDVAHYISAGIVSFARGLNDTPKIVGLMLAINTMNIKWGMLAVATAMAAGGLINARKVGETVGKKITQMNSGQGFTANLITGLLVTTASIHGMPVSTTHVSVGSIFGIGTVTGKANPKIVRNILLSWLLTLPVGALISAIVYWMVLQVK